MKMRMTVLLAAGVLMLAALTACLAAPADTPAAPATAAAGAAAEKGPGHQWMANLTDEQKSQVQEKVKALRAEGKSREEIKAAITELLKGWNIELPPGKGDGKGKGAGRGAGKGQGHAGANGFMAKLTDDQRAQVEAKVKELKAAGKTPEEVRAAVTEMLKGWGIEAPAGRGGRQGGQAPAWMEKLTDEQRTQVQAKIKELKAAGKTQDEIHAAVAEMLKGWGIEVPAGRGGRQGGQAPAWMEKLTDEQRTQVQAKIKELKAAGKTQAEIHAAVAEMLKGWGIEAPQGPQGQGQGGMLKGIMEKLTPAQRTELMGKVKEMRAAGKTREEIKAAVQEMLKGWNIEPPAAK